MADATEARGFIVYEPGEPGVIEAFLVPAPGPGEALVRILASGVCHTDLTVKNGLSRRYRFPVLLGHEGAGIVQAIGEGVENVTAGDHVILAYHAPCGACRFCRSERPHLCADSFTATQQMTTRDGVPLMPVLGLGTFCTHTLVHAAQCVKIDNDLPPEPMCLIGCGALTGVGAALYAAGVRPGQSVAVIGCGGVGDAVIMGAKLAGATTIIAVDIDRRKLA